MAQPPSKSQSEDEPEGGVLAGLPATRPSRMGRRARDGAAAPAKPKAAARKAKAKAKAKAAAKPKAKAKAKPVATRVVEAEAESAAVTPAAPTPIAEGRKPRPVRAGHPGLADRTDNRPEDQREDAGVAGSVVQAAGELASFGAGVAGSVLRGIGKRLPKP